MSYGYYQGFLDSSVGKESICNVGDSGDAGLIPASGRSPGAEDGNALQYPCLKIPMNRRAWWDIVQRVTKSQTWLSMHNDMVIIIFLKVVPCPLPSCFIPSSEILFPHSYLKQRGNGPSSVTASRLSRGIDSDYPDLKQSISCSRVQNSHSRNWLSSLEGVFWEYIWGEQEVRYDSYQKPGLPSFLPYHAFPSFPTQPGLYC